MQTVLPNHYARLGLDRRCTLTQVRAAYRVLIKQHHPDLNAGSHQSLKHSQDLNLAHEVLSDPERRQAYDAELDAAQKAPATQRKSKASVSLKEEVHLGIEEFFRGTKRQVTINDPANPNGREVYELIVPPDTAPGTRIRIPRGEPFSGGHIEVRLKAAPGFRFKARGSDLRCDLKIKSDRATQGGVELIPGAKGSMVRLNIPRNVGRNEIIRVPGEGLPKPRGGRGDLLVRITYKVEVKFSRTSGRQ